MSSFLFSAKPRATQEIIGLLRIIVGLLMAYHGWEVFDPALIKSYAEWEHFKGSSSALTLVYIGKTAELISGVLLTIGFLTRISCIVLAGTMLYLIFVMGNGKVWYDAQHPFLLLLFAVLFFFAGPGAWALDNRK